MSHLWNLQRDMFHVRDTANYSWGVPSPGSSQINVQTNGLVYFDSGQIQTKIQSPSISANNWAGVGVLMDPARENPIPYRVKAYMTTQHRQAYIVVGYSGQNTSNPTLYNVIQFPIETNFQFDEIIVMPALDSNDQYYDRPIGFALACGENQNNQKAEGIISVQKLSEQPPRYASSTS